MGIIKAIGSAVGGGLADQWLEVIEANDMGGQTVFTNGVTVRQDDKRNSNFKGTSSTVSNGSVVHVYDNQFMMLVDGGKIVDYTAEPGYYTVNNSSLPSLFNGQFGATLKESFNRIKFSGVTPTKQQVFFINLQEIKGNTFGTATPVMYYDKDLDADLYIRSRGMYTIKITDPIKFYKEVIERNMQKVEFSQINEQYRAEFMSAFESAINQMSADGISIRTVRSKGTELSNYMRDALDEEWRSLRGFEIITVAVSGLDYDEESQKLLRTRSQGAMLKDASIREGYVQGAVARGLEAAGSNANGSMAGFMGMGFGMQAGGGFMGAASSSNQQQIQQKQQMQQQQAAQQQQMQAQQQAAQQQQSNNEQKRADDVSGWLCECGTTNKGKFCAECGKPQPQKPAGWTCECGAVNTGKFCPECGKQQPPQKIKCDKCGFEPDISNGIPKFCPECGDIINNEDRG